MRRTVYVWEEHAGGEGFWKLLCVCLDAEGHGLLMRLLEPSGLRFRTEVQAC